jgi:hypothetical protein
MGNLTSGHVKTPSPFPDRILQHLQIVIVAKLRRGESFSLSWIVKTNSRSGRMSVWLNPAIPIRFDYDENIDYVINAAWIRALARSADSSHGLFVTPEPPVSSLPI